MTRRGRRAKGRDFKSQKGDKHVGKVDYQKTQRSGSSINDLPITILGDILVRLPLDRILICKRVCKAWHDLISDPQFTKLQSVQGEALPLIRMSNRTLFFVGPPKNYNSFNRGNCICDMKLDTELRIPWVNAESLLNIKGVVTRKNSIYLNHNFRVVNSCNGLLCLSEPAEDRPLLVCNPLTGEYIDLSLVNSVGDSAKNFLGCGLGFSPKTNQYKVIRMFDQWMNTASGVRKYYLGRMAEVHTLGTGSWRSIRGAPYPTYSLACPAYLNGALHWLGFVSEKSDSASLVSFDFENEKFRTFQPPLPRPYALSSLSVLGGRLCICYSFVNSTVDIWVMKDYGVQGSWIKQFSIETLLNGLYVPINYLEDGALLLIHNTTSSLMYYHPKGSKIKRLKIGGQEPVFEAVAHVPSFISLEDAVMRNNVMVVRKSR